MDKRTILFVIFLTISLYFVHTFFMPGAKSPTEHIEKKTNVNQKELQANLSDFPLVDIFDSSDERHLLTQGVLTQNHLLTLSWSNEIPDTIYIKKRGSNLPPKELHLTQKSVTLDGPVLYELSSGKITEISLPASGSFDLKLLMFDHDAKLFLGNYSEGYFQTLSEMPQRNALAFVTTENGLSFAGVYLTENQSIVPLDNFIGFKNLVTVKSFQQKRTHEDQEYYVLQNDYQQVVFTNFGGAISEINLPLQSNKNPKSVVKQTEVELKIAESSPENSHFPDYAYYTPSSKTEGPFTENKPQMTTNFYPLLRRNLLDSNPNKTIKISPRYYALNIVSDYPEVAELIYDVIYFDSNKIVFEAKQNHRKITKTFSFPKNQIDAPYCLDLTLKIDGDSRGLWLTSGIPEVEMISNSATPSLSYRILRNNKAELEKVSLPKQETSMTSVYPNWISNSNGFFTLILDPLSEIRAGFKAYKVDGNAAPSRYVEYAQSSKKVNPQDYPGYEFLLPLPNNSEPLNFRFFAGPLDSEILKRIDTTYTNPVTGLGPGYIGAQSFHGWFAFISEPFAKVLFILMNFFYKITHSWAFSIILLTVALRLMLYPLNAWSIKSMRKMQKITPEVKAIQEKYKKDPKKSQSEIMGLYRSKGVNPFSGCLPILIQMPFLIGMFDLLKSTFALRGASFIPGWIDNLTSPDVLFSWNTPIFFIGTQFHLLPVLLGLVMFVQQKVSSPLPKDKTLWTDQQKQQRFMGYLMVVVFTFMFYNFPSGLNIYWLSSMLLGILQQWITNRMMEKKGKDTQSITQKKKASNTTS